MTLFQVALITEILLILFGFSAIIQAIRLPFWSNYSVGVGFFPVVLGIMVILIESMSVARIVRTCCGTGEVIIEKDSKSSVAKYIMFLVLTAILFNVIGWIPSIIVFCYLMLKIVQKQGGIMSAGFSVALGLATWALCKFGLRIMLPAGMIGF